MFIAMNRFRVKRGCEADFEAVWLNREVFIDREPGFVAFHMLKGPRTEEYSLYVSHTVWGSMKAFEDWTRSESFRAAHKGAGENKLLYIGGPQFEGFEVIQEVKPASAMPE
jgi:heme-degrading monooxygenase HmoA